MDYEVKQNPAPHEWAVLIWQTVENRREISAVATFKGENALQLAVEYQECMSQRGKNANSEHV